MRAIGQALRNLAPSLAFVAPHLRLTRLPFANATGGSKAADSPTARETVVEAVQAADRRPLRLGVCSNHLGDHSIGRMLALLDKLLLEL